MKKLLYIFMLLGCVSLCSCNEVTVGYLDSDNAAFAIDTMEIVRYSNYTERFAELEEILSSYPEEVEALLDELDVLGQYRDSFQTSEEYLRLQNRLVLLGQRYDDYTMTPGYDQEYADKLMAEYDAVGMEIAAYEEAYIWPADDAYWYKYDEIAVLCDELDKDVPDDVHKEIENLQTILDNEVPWTTPELDQILGTEPLHYSLAYVRGDQGQEAADDFAKYVTVRGGGRINVAPRVDSPAGRYTVSLQVKNEGHSAILLDVFTFILK